MNELSLHEILDQFDSVCDLLTKKVSSVDSVSKESFLIIRHKTSCALVEAVADETNREPEVIFQIIKSILEREENRKIQ